MRRIIIYILIAFLLVFFSIVIISLLNPLRRSDERIRANILRLTPIGMSMEDVISVVESRSDWEIRIIMDGGYVIHNDVPRGPHQGGNMISGTQVGVTFMEVHIGSYNFLVFILEERVSIFFGFDEDSNLLDIAVRRYPMDTF